MKIAFNTHNLNQAAAQFYWQHMSEIPGIELNSFGDYLALQFVFFPSYDSDLREMARAKMINPKIITCLLDPRGSQIEQYLPFIDSFIVDSLEMYDYVLRYGKPIFIYHEYPRISAVTKRHFSRNKLLIGYHGNKIHLSSMYPAITTALDKLSKEYDLELIAVYNIRSLGRWNLGRPRSIKIRDVQWHPDVYKAELSHCDIGIVPSVVNLGSLGMIRAGLGRYFNDSRDDYIYRFKMPSNFGRGIVFGLLGIPIVSDFLPSAAQFIQHGRNGFLASSAAGWYAALKTLIVSPELRNSFAKELAEQIATNCNTEIQNERLQKWIMEECFKTTPAGVVIPLAERRTLLQDLSIRNAYLIEKLCKLF